MEAAPCPPPLSPWPVSPLVSLPTSPVVSWPVSTLALLCSSLARLRPLDVVRMKDKKSTNVQVVAIFREFFFRKNQETPGLDRSGGFNSSLRVSSVPISYFFQLPPHLYLLWQWHPSPPSFLPPSPLPPPSLLHSLLSLGFLGFDLRWSPVLVTSHSVARLSCLTALLNLHAPHIFFIKQKNPRIPLWCIFSLFPSWNTFNWLIN